MKNKKKRGVYFNSDDFLNLGFVTLLLIIVLQFTVRIFIINEFAFKIINSVTLILLSLGLFFVALSLRVRHGRYTVSKEDAELILRRYVREHRYSKKVEEYETSLAILAILGENEGLTVIKPESTEYQSIVEGEDVDK